MLLAHATLTLILPYLQTLLLASIVLTSSISLYAVCLLPSIVELVRPLQPLLGAVADAAVGNAVRHRPAAGAASFAAVHLELDC